MTIRWMPLAWIWPGIEIRVRIRTVKAGVRGSTMEYLTLGGCRNAPGESLFEDEDLQRPMAVQTTM